MSPPANEERLEFTKKIVHKRNYNPGEEMKQGDKMRMIKDDIERLRENSGDKYLRESKSVEFLSSVRHGLEGNTKIPEVYT